MFRLCNLKKNSACFSGQSRRNSVMVSRYRVFSPPTALIEDKKFKLQFIRPSHNQHEAMLHKNWIPNSSITQTIHSTYRLLYLHQSPSFELQGLDLMSKAPQSKTETIKVKRTVQRAQRRSWSRTQIWARLEANNILNGFTEVPSSLWPLSIIIFHHVRFFSSLILKHAHASPWHDVGNEKLCLIFQALLLSYRPHRFNGKEENVPLCSC